MIEVRNVNKKFDDFYALSDISVTIPESSIYGMVGTNGAGKSTLLRLMTGVYKADGGQILIDGEDVYENPGAKEKFVYVPDELYFLPGANMDRMSRMYKAVYKRFDIKLFVELSDALKLDRKKAISTFSKGMKRQVAIILAIACKAKYMFFDETFDGLDPVIRNVIKGIIGQEVEANHSTAIITSHSLRELEDTCDQLALIHKGGLVLQSDVSLLKTGLFKVQIAFLEDYDKSKFDGFDIIHFSKNGSVARIIVRGEQEEMVDRFRKLKPVILDVLSLTLEEIFTYEVEALGYDFSKIFEREDVKNG